jgi:hypothetical protein
MTSQYNKWLPQDVKKKRKQPSKYLRHQVETAFDPKMLKDLCTRNDFSSYAERIELAPSAGGRERFYYYQDNGSDILAIAHLDTVQRDRFCTVVNTAAGLVAFSGGLDDRLGVYVILDMLPKLGVTVDWLLTTDEEIGQSTANAFWTDKEYNWMFQFDRGGTDVVMYQYETDALVNLVESAGAQVGVGIFSDICTLDGLGCAGFNWGVGYQDYHSTKSHAYLDDTFRMVARFVKFYRANRDTKLVHEDDWIGKYSKKYPDDDEDWEKWNKEYYADKKLITPDDDEDEKLYRQLVAEREAQLDDQRESNSAILFGQDRKDFTSEDGTYWHYGRWGWERVSENGEEVYNTAPTLMQDQSKQLHDWFEKKKQESTEII